MRRIVLTVIRNVIPIGHGDFVLDIVSNGEVIMPEDIEMWCIIDKPPKE